MAISDRHFDILHALVARCGQIVAKDALITAAWRDVAVGDNSLEQAISNLRKLLGSAPGGTPYIETLARRGYRFTPAVTRTATRATDSALEALLAPYRAFVEGRSAIETLERDGVGHARHAFARAIEESPDYAPAHIGLANAAVLAFEATRSDEMPDRPALLTAVHHAREACRLASDSGEAWATLSFVLSRGGACVDEAVAAGRRAVAIEPDNWRHLVRLAYATWGEDRLRPAHDAIRLLPGLALAHWLAASVYIARQAFEEAMREARAGAAAQDQQQGGRFGFVGLHLVVGLIHAARGDDAAAEEALHRELAFEPTGHIFSRQACANAWLTIGALRVRRSQTAAAVEAFRRALERVPGHPFALAALSVLSEQGGERDRLASRVMAMHGNGALVEAAMTRAAVDTLTGRHAEAAARVHDALKAAPAGGSAGWTLPVEPLLQVGAQADLWAPALAVLRNRAA